MDLLTVVGHKMCASKGIGALYIRSRTHALEPQLVGGGQEHGLRAATENVPGIVALGAAASIAQAERDTDAARIRGHRDRLLGRRTATLPRLRVNGSLTHRLPGNLSLTFPGVTADQLMVATPELAFLAGSICHSGDTAPSSVLTAVGLTPDEAVRTIRLSIGRYATSGDITTAADRLIAAVTAPARL